MKKTLSFLLIAALSEGSVFAQITSGPGIAETNTEYGKVRGYIHNGIFTYKGMPYATAGRFETPKKPAKWEAVRSSMVYGPVSPLMTPTTQVHDESEFVFSHDWGFTNEDCMRINVWTPGINDGKKRPVLFWIHGGGFAAGSSQELPSYDGEALAKKGDVVVVSINHRLNILGFLDLSAFGDKYKTSANNSIVDMAMALEWVRDNISNFGGDAGNVMIFGQSGGGAKVNTLMAMPRANGLFHKAVNQSGAFRSNMLEKKDTQKLGVETLKELGIAPDKVDEIQKVPYDKLVAAGNKALKIVADQMKAEGRPVQGFGLGWGPSLDGEVLPYQPLSVEALQLSKNVPLMIGTVKNEFMASMGANLTDATEAEVDAFIAKKYGEKATAYKAAAKKAYPGYKKPSDLIDIDAMFRPGTVNQANVKSEVSGGAPVYVYLFDWQSPTVGGKYKSMHCMELPFVFNNIQRCEEMTGGGKEAIALAAKVSQAWINFAKTGDPNHPGLPVWPKYNSTNTSTMHFDLKCTVQAQQDKELFDLLK